jgi:hypothetical protein
MRSYGKKLMIERIINSKYMSDWKIKNLIYRFHNKEILPTPTAENIGDASKFVLSNYV